MIRYLSLLSFTQQGVSQVKNSPARAKVFADLVKAAGGSVIVQYWSIGEVDGVLVFEAPDEKVAAGLLLKLAQQGDVRTRSMRVYNDQEFAAVSAGL